MVNCSCGCTERLHVGAHLAKLMRDDLFNELGFTCCAGVSYNKFLAKLVGSANKPNKQTTLPSTLAQDLVLSVEQCRRITGDYPRELPITTVESQTSGIQTFRNSNIQNGFLLLFLLK